MHVNESLNKEILKMLLLYLLDVRATRRWARSLWQESRYFYRPQDHYSLIDQLGSEYSKDLDHLVKDRLHSLALQNQLDIPLLLEKVQLLAWRALRSLEEGDVERLVAPSEKPFFEKKLQDVVEALVKLEDELKSLRFLLFKSSLKQAIEFLTRAIRLEMKEIRPPQDKVENGIALMEKAYGHLESAADCLKKQQMPAYYQWVKQALNCRPHSLNHQTLELFAFLLTRFARASEKLEKPGLFQKPSYRLYLLERADKALKRSCHLLRLFHRESRLNPIWQERLQHQMNANWQIMIDRLEHETHAYGQSETAHWILWSHLAVYRLGLGFSGQPQPLKGIEEAIYWVKRDTQVKHVQLRLVIALLALINESLAKPQVSEESIDRIRLQLETIQQVSPSLVPSLNRCLQDLCLLYTRVEPISSESVLQASGRLLSIGWQLENPETVVVSLQCLEDLFDVWTGSSLKMIS